MYIPVCYQIVDIRENITKWPLRNNSTVSGHPPFLSQHTHHCQTLTQRKKEKSKINCHWKRAGTNFKHAWLCLTGVLMEKKATRHTTVTQGILQLKWIQQGAPLGRGYLTAWHLRQGHFKMACAHACVRTPPALLLSPTLFPPKLFQIESQAYTQVKDTVDTHVLHQRQPQG